MIEEKAFAVLTKDSVRLMAESAGHASVQDETAALLGEDVSYRLREAVMKSAAFMKNAKRRRLCPEDFNQALRNSDIQPVLGHGTTTDSSPFRQTRDGELHFVEDAEISLNNAVFNSYVPKSLGKPSVKGQWMAVEGMNKLSTYNSHSSAYKNVNREVPDELMSYYKQVTRALFASHPVLVQWALTDLSTNVSIVPLLPYFANFISNGVKTVNHVSKLLVLMRTVESLLNNQALFLEPQPYLNLLVQALESCLLESLAGHAGQDSKDHWMLRHFAAQLLAHIVREWNNKMNHLLSALRKQLSEVLQDLNRPLCSHYGAVMGLISLGCAEVKRVLVPQLDTLLPHIVGIMEDVQRSNQQTRSDALKVHGAVQLAVEKLMKSSMDEFVRLCEREDSSKKTEGGSPAIQHTACDILVLYKLISHYFGDSLLSQMPVMDLYGVFGKHPAEDCVNLGDRDSRRSGDDLLADLMQQVKQEERQQHWWLENQGGSRLGNGESAAAYLQGGGQASGSEPADQVIQALRYGYNPCDASDVLERGDGFQEQMAVSSSSVTDPTRGMLKIKIKRHGGHGSPSQTPHKVQMNKVWAESEEHHLTKEGFDLSHRHKQKQSSRKHEDHRGMEYAEMSELEMNQQLVGHATTSDRGFGSDPSLERKGKLMVKLKVPSKRSPFD